MRLRQRVEVDGVAGGEAQQRLQELHRRHALLRGQDHSCYTCTGTNQNSRLTVQIAHQSRSGQEQSRLTGVATVLKYSILIAYL